MVTPFALFASLKSAAPYEGLYLAGQKVMAPALTATILGSCSTGKLILDADAFRREIRP